MLEQITSIRGNLFYAVLFWSLIIIDLGYKMMYILLQFEHYGCKENNHNKQLDLYYMLLSPGSKLNHKNTYRCLSVLISHGQLIHR